MSRARGDAKRARHSRRLRPTLVALALLLSLGACAGGSVQRGIVRHDVGRGTRGDIEARVVDILSLNGYAVRERRDTGTLIYYETAWLSRKPFDDEAARGAEECRTRILVEARKGSNETYSVTLRAENSALGITLDGDWAPMAATPMFREHVSEVATSIGMRIDAGVRIR